MIKRLLGINKLEKNFKLIGGSLNRSWEWINHFNKVNSANEDRLARLEKSNIQLIEITRELLNRLQQSEQKEEVELNEEVSEPEVEEVSVPNINENVSLADKDLYLMQLVYQYAAFSRERAIDTNTLFANLPYKITSRGLRKKLEALVSAGLLQSVKKGNVRYWFLNHGALGKIKKALKMTE